MVSGFLMTDASPPPPPGFKVVGAGPDPDPPQGYKVSPSSGHGASAAYGEGEVNEGLSFADRAGIQAHDTTNETKLFLEKRYGKGSVSLEWGDGNTPRMFVMKEGKKIEVQKENMGFLSGAVADSPVIAGSILGSEAGAAAGRAGGWPGSLIGGIIGSAAGAVAGYEAREGVKEVAGTRSKTWEQEKGQMKEQAIGGAVGEVGGRVVGRALRGEIPRFFTGVTDESKRLFDRAKAGGAIPHWATSGEDLKKLARIEVDATKVTGRYAKQFEANRKYVLSEVAQVLEKGGMPKPYIDATLKEIHNPTSAFSGREVGEMIQKAIQAQSEALETHVAENRAVADKLIDPALAEVKKLTQWSGPDAAVVEAKASGAWSSFKSAANDSYDKLHGALGGAKIVPVGPIREAAQQILSQLPKSTNTPVTKELGKLGEAEEQEFAAQLEKEFGISLPVEGNISLKDAQRIRTVLRERGRATALQRNTTQGDHMYLSQATDDAIDLAANDPSVAPFVKSFRDINSWYKATRAKFDDATIQKLQKLTRTDAPPSPAQVVGLITSSGKASTVNQVRKIVGEGTWKQVQSQDLRTLLGRVSSRDESGAMTIDGMKLLNWLDKDKSGPMVEAVHGSAVAADLRELGKTLAVRGGKLPPEALAKGNVREALTAVKESEKKLDEYLHKNLLSELNHPTMPPEKAYNAILSGESMTIAAVNLLKNDPVRLQALRQTALEQLARLSEMSAITDFGKNAMGEGLKQFTAKQQELLFPRGLAKDINELDKIIRFIYPGVKEGTMASMHAGSILEKPILGKGGHITQGRWYIQATKAVARYVALNPTFMQYVLHGLPMTTTRKIINGIVSGTARTDILEGMEPEQIQDIKRPQ